MRLSAWIGLATLLSSSNPALAETRVPEALQEWTSWVLYGAEYRRCPLRNGAAPTDAGGFECRWPGRLHLTLGAQGGEFSQRWRIYTEDWITLPGDETHWPEDVRIDGAPAAVVPHDGAPRVRVKSGEHGVTGRFTWARRPESLRVAPATALVDLTIDGAEIAPVDLRADRLWLGAVRAVEQPRALDVQVYRLLQDGSPMRLSTQLHLKASGDAREEVLARALPDGFTPLATRGELPFRFEPDGRVRVQVRSGEHVLEIESRAVDVADRYVLPTSDGAWADAEIWSYRSADRLRITAIEGAQPIDPAQAGVPYEWTDAPSYRLPRGATMTIVERSRGINAQDANRLSLQRELWYAFDRDGFDAVDRITGSMQQGWRLDMAAPYRLLNARSAGEMLLVTDGADARTGVEVRTPTLQVSALSSIEPNGALPATGWAARFDAVSTELHLPPGHRLLAAWGVDDAPEAWLETWRLLDLFLLLLVAATAYRLLGWRGGVIAAIVMLLTHHEVGAPGWLWINALIAVAIVRIAPEGRFGKWSRRYQLVSLGVLALALAPYALNQYRLALHPQLRPDVRPFDFGLSRDEPQAFGLAQLHAPALMSPPDYAVAFNMPAEAPAAAMDAASAAGEAAPAADLEMLKLEEAATRANIQPPRRLDRYAPDAMLQTGPGTPDWRFVTYRLHWSGPVDAAQTMRLMILPPTGLAFWRLLGMALSVALLVALVRSAFGGSGRSRGGAVSAATLVVSLCVLGLFCLPTPASAQTPDAEALAELKRRLIEPPPCAPQCAQIVFAGIDLSGDRLAIDMEVHAQTNVALGMPHAGAAWIIERVAIDGAAADALSRRDESLQLPLAPGVHRVAMVGRIAEADELSLEFPAPPRRVAVRSQGWDATGSSEGRLLNTALQLTRRVGANANAGTLRPQRPPPFVRVHRRVFMNLDWTIETVVERLAPEEGAFTMSLPLLPGEAVLTSGFEVRGGEVLVSMPAGQSATSWQSSLERVDRLRWSAASGQPWVEQWDVVVSPTWHADFSGTPAILPSEYVSGLWVNQFLPRPGETLDIAIVRPIASAGATLAVDRVNVDTTPGRRLTNTHLELHYRSSRGGRHELRLPQDARVSDVAIDRASIPLRPVDGVLPLTLAPGAHVVSVAFSRDEGVGFISRPSLIDIGADGTNVRTTMTLGPDRWLLFAWGEGVGPAVLYWSELALFVVLALCLGRIGGTPLTTRDWLLLGLGLSTFSWWVLLVFGAWMFALARRDGWKVESPRGFNALQLALAALSILALVVVVSAIPYGLLGEPHMGVVPDPSYGPLTWFVDRTDAQLTQPGVLSVPMWVYKAAMLLWALWLSFAMLRWLPWAWRRYTSQGLWKARVEATES